MIHKILENLDKNLLFKGCKYKLYFINKLLKNPCDSYMGESDQICTTFFDDTGTLA